MKLTLKDLAYYDGKDGKPAYIAFNGDIYDVTDSSLWANGKHFRTHDAGTDLSVAMSKAPHTKDKLAVFPIVGKLDATKAKNQEIVKGKATSLQKLYYKYHPHPIVVHFPMGLVPFAFLMQIISLWADNFLFFYAGYFASVVALIGAAGAVASGFASWKINYSGALSRIFKVKLILSIFLFASLVGVAAYGSRFLDGFYGISNLADADKTIYTIVLALNMAFALGLGYNGGKLTWPEKD